MYIYGIEVEQWTNLSILNYLSAVRQVGQNEKVRDYSVTDIDDSFECTKDCVHARGSCVKFSLVCTFFPSYLGFRSLSLFCTTTLLLDGKVTEYRETK